MSYFTGKGLYGNRVVVNPRHRKFELLYEFHDERESKQYYNSFNLDEESLPVFHKIKLLLCRHEDEYDLDVGSKLHHYIYCPKCSRAIYINDETEEDRLIRKEEMRKWNRRYDIEEMEQAIANKKKELIEMKEDFKKEFGEEAT